MTTLPPHDDVVLRSLLERNAATSPDAPFVAFEDGTRWTRREALDETYAAANQLARHGIGQGDRVGIFLPNGPDFLRAWWGANALGAIIVPINLAYRGAILAHLLTLAQPTVVITDRDLAALLDEGGQAVASLDPAELRGSDTTPPCLDTGQHLWDPAAYLLTSGTTGPSKLSITTYHQLYLSGNDFIRSWNGNPDDVCLVDLPLFHLAGLFLITGSAVVGAQIAVRTAPAMSTYWEVARDTGATLAMLLSTMVPYLLAQPVRAAETVLKSAVRNRLIAFNPADDVQLPKRRRRDTDDRIITRDAFRRTLLPAVPARYRALVATAGGCGLRWGEAIGLCADAIDLESGQLKVIRTVTEVSGNTTFKPFPKSSAGRRTVPLPAWLVDRLAAHIAAHPLGERGLVFPNAVGKPLRRTLFRSRVWRPALIRAGMLGSLTRLNGRRWRATWQDSNGVDVTEEFTRERAAILAISANVGEGLRFHDLRHCYATWLVDDGLPINMVQRVLGHEKSATTLDLYTPRTDNSERILRALDDDDDDDDDETVGVPAPM